MKIACVQFAPAFKKIETNFEFLVTQSKSIDADLVCFPELSLTGYFFFSTEEVLPYSIPFNSELIGELQNIATAFNRIIVFGFPERVDAKVYNSCAVLFPDSAFSFVYRKTHLFYRERFVFTSGDTGFIVAKYPPMDINIGTMICYDWRFPESARALALGGADLIVCPSNLVTKVWTLAMPARSIENKVYLAVANRIGIETNNDETLHFNGKSGIWDYNGKLIATASEDKTEVIFAEIYPQETRNKAIDHFNNIFADRRPEMYKVLLGEN